MKVQVSMKIKELYQKNHPVLSFEIFPPKPDYPLETIFETITALQDLKPQFISVTYGAGGSNRGRTIEIASQIKKGFQTEALAHLTCVGHSPGELDEMLDRLTADEIENVLALRGDPPRGMPDFVFQPGHYRYAVELVRHIRGRDNFCVGAAAYAEGHSECRRWREDWDFLRQKVEAGVDFLITQLYFDNRVFYNFKENLLRIGVAVPVSAGIMPVLGSNQIRQMVYLSGASIPASLLKILDKYGNDKEEFEKAGIDFAITQINDLLANGVEGIHLCTMNRVRQTRMIVEQLKLAGRNDEKQRSE
jgi:methylenetetrahydrofolate reductase (NADPH)